MKVDVNINLVGASTSVDVESLVSKLDEVLALQREIKVTATEMKAELVAANEVTNEIAADIDELSKRTAGALTQAEAAEVGAELTALKVKLQAVAAVHTPGSPV